MIKSLEQVKEFHRTYGHPIAETVGEETLEVRQLRIKLLFEELEELSEATDCKGTFENLCMQSCGFLTEDYTTSYEDGNNVDHVEELDALADLQVVLDGKYLTSGHWKVKEEASTEVHGSNMSKICTTVEKASRSVYQYTNSGINCHKEEMIDANGTQYWIIVRKDGKILKGIDFKKPNLKQFVK